MALGIKPANETFSIFSVYPNPASTVVRVHFGLAAPAMLDASLTDMTGRRVAGLMPATQLQAGLYDLDFAIPGSIAAGTYIMQMKGADFSMAFPVTIRR